jgi:hypothetical protein
MKQAQVYAKKADQKRLPRAAARLLVPPNFGSNLSAKKAADCFLAWESFLEAWGSGGNPVPAVFHASSQDSAFIRARTAKGECGARRQGRIVAPLA